MILSKFVSEAKTISSRRELVQSPGLLMNWARLNRESEKCKKLLRDLNNWRSWKDIEKKDSTGRFNCMRSKDEKKKMKWRGIEILRIKDKSTSKNKKSNFLQSNKSDKMNYLKNKKSLSKSEKWRKKLRKREKKNSKTRSDEFKSIRPRSGKLKCFSQMLST